MRVVSFVLVLALMGTGGWAQTALPLHVQADLLLVRIDNALSQGQSTEAIELVDQLRALGANLATGQLDLLDARTAIAAGDFIRAEGTLTRLLTEAAQGSAAYAAGLEMLATLPSRRDAHLVSQLDRASVLVLAEQFDQADAVLLGVLAQATPGTPPYTQALQALARLPEQRAAAAAAAVAVRQREAEMRANIARHMAIRRLQEQEAELYANDPLVAREFQVLRWLLHVENRGALAQPVPVGPELTDEERGWLVTWRSGRGLRSGVTGDGLRFVDAAVLQAVQNTVWTPLRDPLESLDGYAAHQDWFVFREPDTRNPGQFNCAALTWARNAEPRNHYNYPFMGIGVSSAADGHLLYLTPLFAYPGTARVQIDSRSENFNVLEGGLIWPSQEQARFLLLGFRQGTQAMISGTLAALPGTTELGFSLRGFTRAFREMATLCARDDWVRAMR